MLKITFSTTINNNAEGAVSYEMKLAPFLLKKDMKLAFTHKTFAQDAVAKSEHHIYFIFNITRSHLI
ncbi:hypothetical protein CWD94_25980 [Lysinibacillus xylanilyticus]|uniref:Uncharacterized protein n=1 Tax=Lysinibacillus xylanilyticus TaxID=582475 RepID=A0A2M9PYH1_9BACI|nr:hypothetical protein CWD94_25980 [Lysinibacillus xylanilyticus]